MDLFSRHRFFLRCVSLFTTLSSCPSILFSPLKGLRAPHSHLMKRFAFLLLVAAVPCADGLAEAPTGNSKAGQNAGAIESNTQDGEIRAVLARNRAAREAVTSYSMRITWEQREFPTTPLDAPLPEGTLTSYGEGVWVEAGEKFRVHRTKRWERETSGPVPGLPPGARGPDLPMAGKEYSTWAVYNGDYFANHSQRLPDQIYLYPRKVLDAGIGAARGELFPYPLQWGFGAGGGYVDTEYENGVDHPRVRWIMEKFEAADGPKIRLTRQTTINTEGRVRRTEFVLDPVRDYLLVAARLWDPSSNAMIIERVLQLREWPCGRWYPGEATVRRLDKYERYEFDEVRLNEPVEDDTFDFMSFDLDYTKVSLQRRDTPSSETRFLYRDGEWIPESLVPPGDRPPRPEAERL